jgi:hypothetical protein
MFTKAMVLTGQGPDIVYLTTDKPSPFKAYSYPPSFSFEAEAGTGVAYVKANFNLDAELVNRGAKLQHFNK